MSDQDDNIFNKEPTDPVVPSVEPVTPPVGLKEPGDTTPPVNQYVDLLASIIREDGTQKYASVEDVFKALTASQGHIQTLETDNATLKSEVESRQNAEDLFDKIKATQQNGQPSELVSEVDLIETIKQLVPETLQNLEANKTAATNLESVVTTLKSMYGDKADEQFYSKGAELGLNQEKMNELASTSPSAIFKMLGVETTKISQRNLESDINTVALNIQQNPDIPSLKIPQGATGKDFANVWRNADKVVNN